MWHCVVMGYPIYTQSPLLIALEKKVLENAGNQDFLLLPQCFLLFPTQISIFESL